MILNFLYFFGYLLSIFLFVLGIIFITFSLFKKLKNRNLLYVGILFCGIPVLLFLLNFSGTLFAKKPTEHELVGTYKISKANTTNIDLQNLDKYELKLYENGKFSMTQIPIIQLCENGKYDLDYSFELNELSFYCNDLINPAHIDSRIGGFSIEFIIGDPDSGESIFFEKVK